ncbi:histidine kinase dimerization/phospho-acceptor domain-containing protein [Tepidibacter sp. Z1-5]|uniref:histidine kinase dimerization/phospho-acceptor domain-containing protein n=1 Tax=Tepidibacter sp. Z1-5 TaxID=3134138 RepID=UPI0030BC6845
MKRFCNDKKIYFLIILVFLFSIICYYMLFQTIVDNKNIMINLNNEKLHSIVSQINSYLQDEEENLKIIKYGYHSMESNNYNFDIEEIILGIIKQEQCIEGVGIINNKGIVTNYISKNTQLYETSFNKPVIDEEYVDYILSKENTVDIIEGIKTYKNCISILSPYKDKDKELIFFININSQKLFSILDSATKYKNEYIFAIDDNNNNVLQPFKINTEIIVNTNDKLAKDIKKKLRQNKKGYINRININGKENIISYEKIKDSPWTVLYAKNMNKIYIPLFEEFIMNLTILIFTGMIIYLIIKIYYLQMKREQDFWIYKRKRMEMLIQISAGIAHEIGNPLSTIKGYVQINHAKKPSDLSHIAINELKKIENILNKSLKLSKPLNQNKKSYQPHEIIEEIHYLIEAAGLLKDVDIEYNIDESLPNIGFSKDNLRFIIIDIIQHVIKAQDKNGLVEIGIQKTNEQYMQFNIYSNKYERDRDKGLNDDFINMIKKIIKFNNGKLDIIKNKDGTINIQIKIPFDSN